MALGRCEYDRPLLVARPAPVAQRIEHRPPEPVAQVRVLPGALPVYRFFGSQRGRAMT
jgi:hypothetical protein